MTLSELYALLIESEIPVAYSHFATAKQPPFITYSRTSTSNIFADNKVYEKNENVTVELYTAKKDIAKEAQLEEIFDDNEIPYEIVGDNFIDVENVRQVIYEINI